MTRRILPAPNAVRRTAAARVLCYALFLGIALAAAAAGCGEATPSIAAAPATAAGTPPTAAAAVSTTAPVSTTVAGCASPSSPAGPAGEAETSVLREAIAASGEAPAGYAVKDAAIEGDWAGVTMTGASSQVFAVALHRDGPAGWVVEKAGVNLLTPELADLGVPDSLIAILTPVPG